MMEIETSKHIELEVQDHQWNNKKAGYNNETTEKRKKYEEKKWVAADDYEKLRSLADEMFEQLELMGYEKKAKETYDEFEEELNALRG